MRLNKSQIEAMASKIVHESNEERRETFKKKSKKYIPDALKVVQLRREKELLDKKISAIFSKYPGYYLYHGDSQTVENISVEMAKRKEKVKELTEERVREALVIASVDSNDMETLMKKYKKFLI